MELNSGIQVWKEPHFEVVLNGPAASHHLRTGSGSELCCLSAEERNFKFLLPSAKDAFHLVSAKP